MVAVKLLLGSDTRTGSASVVAESLLPAPPPLLRRLELEAGTMAVLRHPNCLGALVGLRKGARAPSCTYSSAGRLGGLLGAMR